MKERRDDEKGKCIFKFDLNVNMKRKFKINIMLTKKIVFTIAYLYKQRRVFFHLISTCCCPSFFKLDAPPHLFFPLPHCLQIVVNLVVVTGWLSNQLLGLRKLLHLNLDWLHLDRLVLIGHLRIGSHRFALRMNHQSFFTWGRRVQGRVRTAQIVRQFW
jgi:hypothetical protein